MAIAKLFAFHANAKGNTVIRLSYEQGLLKTFKTFNKGF